MAIPVEADGIVNDEKAFAEQIEQNANKLTEEIASSRDAELDYQYYEDEGVIPVNKKETKLSAEQLAKIAKRKSVLGGKAFSFFGIW